MTIKAIVKAASLRSCTAVMLVLALGGSQTAQAAAVPASPAVPAAPPSAAAALPDAPGQPTEPAFPVMPAQAGQLQSSTPKMLHIVILDGEGALNNIKERTAREPIVQIEDENHKPVAGASVLFLIQNGDAGAGASFNSVSSFTTVSDVNGRAIGRGLKPNQTSGKYTISVSATAGMLVAMAIIDMSNVSGEGGGVSTHAAHHGVPKWAIVGGILVIVTVVIVATLLATENKGATITPGTGTITP